ncbi:MAG: hypothetical protein U0744_20340 [Gemmataceae bacterium]
MQLPNVHIEKDSDEIRAHVSEAKTFQTAMTGVRRTLKGWQEEADVGRERRGWRWMLEGDTDDNGYDLRRGTVQASLSSASRWTVARLRTERRAKTST